MNRLLPAFFLIVASFCCCSVKDAQQDGTAGSAGDGKNVVQMRNQSPAAFKQNISIIEGRIDTVVTVDDRDFRVVMSIFSSTPEEDIASFAEAGQQIACTPDYFSGEDGVVDEHNNRNIGLMSLRGAKNGESIKARISLDGKGVWKIIEIIERKDIK